MKFSSRPRKTQKAGDHFNLECGEGQKEPEQGSPQAEPGLGKWHFRPTFIVECPSSCSDARNWSGMLQGTPRQAEPGHRAENLDKYKPHRLKGKRSGKTLWRKQTF